jgi:hypothetical protein
VDQIDQSLFEAWMRVGKRCQADRVEALRRSRRLHQNVATRPQRPLCMVIRAADTRIDSYRAGIDPAGFDVEHLEHLVHLDGRFIRDLCKPVCIEPPGLPADKAGRLLGVSEHVVRQWVRGGHLHVFETMYCRSVGRWGRPVPLLYTPSPIDPNNFEGRPPDGLWGTLWQWKHEKFPEDYVQSLRRVPRFRKWKKEFYFRGWDWLCPGRWVDLGSAHDQPIESAAEQAMRQRLAEMYGSDLEDEAPEGERLVYNGRVYGHSGCGRVCKYLFAPLRGWTLAKSTGYSWSLDMPEDSGLAGAWEPGMNDMALRNALACFACKECWRVWNITMTNKSGWNDFVTYISGGLLYGHEVKRPLEDAPMIRKNRFSPRPSKRKRKKDATAGIQSNESLPKIAAG